MAENMGNQADTPKKAVLQSQAIHPTWTALDHMGWLEDNGYEVPPVTTVMLWMREHVESGAVADLRSLG